ncbi:MAG: YchJ family metal-binding protein [Corynebacterium sp.]|nr:YchJ family metal-binding protein [Corynebacterium sp.]
MVKPLFPLSAESRCPCGTGLNFGLCCQKYHLGTPAPTALTLMRSRFSAFVTGDEEYLLRSWDPQTRPASLNLAADTDIKFYRLDIIDTDRGGALDDTGMVEFEAFYKGTVTGSQRERSVFRKIKHDGKSHWVYTAPTESY